MRPVATSQGHHSDKEPAMARKLTPAERLASADKDLLLEEIADQSSWDLFLVERAVFHFGQRHDEWSCNNSLRTGGIIAHTGRMVPSTQANTHGHRIAVWTLTTKGRQIAAQRRNARAQQRSAA